MYYICNDVDLALVMDGTNGGSQADGAILVKTKQAILVAEYIHPFQAGEATPIVEGLADYLISVGY